MRNKQVALIAYDPTFTRVDLNQKYAWVCFDYGDEIYFRLRFASIDDAERELVEALEAVRDLRKKMPRKLRAALVGGPI